MDVTVSRCGKEGEGKLRRGKNHGLGPRAAGHAFAAGVRALWPLDARIARGRGRVGCQGRRARACSLCARSGYGDIVCGAKECAG